jgi:hypothetical protein
MSEEPPLRHFLNKYFGFSGFIYSQPFAHVCTFLLAVVLFKDIREQITDEHKEWEVQNNMATVEVAGLAEK